MSKKITRENRKFKFETLQLHVGRSKQIRLRMQEQFPFNRHRPMYSITVGTQRRDLA